MGAALELALDDQRQGRALDAADREEVGAEAARRERDRASERRTPDQVDVLAGGAGVGQRIGELVELAEGALDLVLGQRRVAGALDPQRAGVGGLRVFLRLLSSITWPGESVAASAASASGFSQNLSVL